MASIGASVGDVGVGVGGGGKFSSIMSTGAMCAHEEREKASRGKGKERKEEGGKHGSLVSRSLFLVRARSSRSLNLASSW